MPRVRGVTASASRVVSGFHVSRSESTSTGVAPVYRTAFAVAIIVNVGITTSSPGPSPKVARARWSDVVPFEHATPYRQPTSCAKVSSNSRTKRPADEIQFDWTHWVR